MSRSYKKHAITKGSSGGYKRVSRQIFRAMSREVMIHLNKYEDYDGIIFPEKNFEAVNPWDISDWKHFAAFSIHDARKKDEIAKKEVENGVDRWGFSIRWPEDHNVKYYLQALRK
jgi:hypothetical protein